MKIVCFWIFLGFPIGNADEVMSAGGFCPWEGLRACSRNVVFQCSKNVWTQAGARRCP